MTSAITSFGAAPSENGRVQRDEKTRARSPSATWGRARTAGERGAAGGRRQSSACRAHAPGDDRRTDRTWRQATGLRHPRATSSEQRDVVLSKLVGELGDLGLMLVVPPLRQCLERGVLLEVMDTLPCGHFGRLHMVQAAFLERGDGRRIRIVEPLKLSFECRVRVAGHRAIGGQGAGRSSGHCLHPTGALCGRHFSNRGPASGTPSGQRARWQSPVRPPAPESTADPRSSESRSGASRGRRRTLQ